MEVEEEKEKGGAVGVKCANKSPISDITGDVDAGRECMVNMGGVVYSEEEPRDNLCDEADS